MNGQLTGSRNVSQHVTQAPSCVWVIYLGQWKCNSAKAPQTHMFPSPAFCSCVSVGEHYSQNEDPKIKSPKDLEYLSKIIVELENILWKCSVSVFCSLFLTT